MIHSDGSLGQPNSRMTWAYMADRSNGNTLMTSPGGHSLDALCFCLREFKELSSVVANQRQRVKIVETGETIEMTAPRPDTHKRSPPKAARSHRSTSKGGTANGTGFLFEIHGTEGRSGYRAGRSSPGDLHTSLRVHCARCAGRANHSRISQYRRAIAGFHPRFRRGFLSTLRSSTCGWLKAFAKESPSAQTSMWPSNATSCLMRFRRRRTPESARFFSDATS